MRSTLWVLFFVMAIPTLIACADNSDSSSDAGTDTDTDTDTDTGTSYDDPDCPNPGIEQEGAGLLWQTCLAGQCLEEHPESGVEECMGEADEVEWEQASDACYTGWRLPTRDEMMALLGDCTEIDTDNDQADCNPCFESTVCDGIFPGVEDLPLISRLHLHWTSTEFDETNAWFARFQEGVVKKDAKNKKYTVHCVRDAE
jgi:hypothetical protein